MHLTDTVTDMRVHGPERLGGQGLDAQQTESGNRLIATLLADPVVGPQIDLLLTWRPTGYEAWAERGMVRFQRFVDDDGRLHFQVLEVLGQNPVAQQDPLALNSVELEARAAQASGFDASEPSRRFIAPEQQSYPFAYERIAQLFDSPNAPDIAVSPRDWCSGSQPGTHGALHVRQSRAPLWFSGRGVRAGHHPAAARAVDIAPTCLAAMGFPRTEGVGPAGVPSADVYLARQDGSVLHDVVDKRGARPTHLYVFLLDGLHHTELERQLVADPTALPNIRRLRERAAVMDGGSMVNFPSITWPSHTTIGTGTWCGHHDVVNPTYYLRDTRETVSPQGLQVGTERFASTAVESLHEAFQRAHPDCITAAIHAPFGRSATHAVLEGRNVCDRARLKELTAQFSEHMNPRWADEHQSVASESLLDTRGLAQVVDLFTSEGHEPPRFVYHELALTDGAGHEYGPHSQGLSDALAETDLRIGEVLAVLDQQGLFDDTLFVLTADHGMAPQDTSLRANPAGHALEAGFAAVVAEPMIWLLDLHVEAERKPDLRTARVVVSRNDPDPSGEREPVQGAEVVAVSHRSGRSTKELARGRTDANGMFAFATPSDTDTNRISLTIHAEGFNPRHVLLDGTPLGVDPRGALYFF
jgi:hypothetical protein